jgi:hypothetical protein
MTPTEYRDAGREYMGDARDALAEVKYAQASEKLWGASAVTVKAVAENRGWPHDGHAQLFSAVNRLADETGDPELRDLFRGAGFLHTNFYEKWMSPEYVEQAFGQVERFIGKLEEYLEVS